MDFAKLQATGNDFVLVDARDIERDWCELARDICHRRLGVGADGLLFIVWYQEGRSLYEPRKGQSG